MKVEFLKQYGNWRVGAIDYICDSNCVNNLIPRGIVRPYVEKKVTKKQTETAPVDKMVKGAIKSK